MKKAIIFDLDGTLLNTLADLAASVNAALAQMDFPSRTAEEVRMFIGDGVGKLIERAVPPASTPLQTEQCLANFRRYYAAHIRDYTVAYPGIPQLLDDLKARGYKLAVASNKGDQLTKTLCRLMLPQIDAALGSGPYLRKPDPHLINSAMEQLGVSPQESLYLGDTRVDVQAAAAAQVDFIGVLWGFRDRPHLTAAGCAAFISHPSELMGFANRDCGPC